MLLLFVVALGLFLSLFRLYSILPGARSQVSPPSRSRGPKHTSLAVFLGSGGHTSEALALISALDFCRYSPRIYVISDGDHLSAHKATVLELAKSAEVSSQVTQGPQPQYSVLRIPRARQIHQSLFTTPPTALVSLLCCIYHVTVAPLLPWTIYQSTFADVIILNGPGTCFVLGLAVYLNKFIGLRAPRIFYIESFARVRSLSLSGRLLRPFVDRFVVQWPQLLHDQGRGECHDWLV